MHLMNMVALIYLVLFCLCGKTIFHDTLQTSFSLFLLPKVNTAPLEHLSESAQFFSRKRTQTSKDSKTT